VTTNYYTDAAESHKRGTLADQARPSRVFYRKSFDPMIHIQGIERSWEVD
jgi:hypothetical protein